MRQFIADNIGIDPNSKDLQLVGNGKKACRDGELTKEMRFKVKDRAYTDAVIAFIARNETSPCVAAIMAAPEFIEPAGDGESDMRLAAALGAAAVGACCCLLLGFFCCCRRRKEDPNKKVKNDPNYEEAFLNSHGKNGGAGGGSGGKSGGGSGGSRLPKFMLRIPGVRNFLDPNKFTKRFDIRGDEDLTKVGREAAMGEDGVVPDAPPSLPRAAPELPSSDGSLPDNATPEVEPTDPRAALTSDQSELLGIPALPEQEAAVVAGAAVVGGAAAVGVAAAAAKSKKPPPKRVPAAVEPDDIELPPPPAAKAPSKAGLPPRRPPAAAAAADDDIELPPPQPAHTRGPAKLPPRRSGPPPPVAAASAEPDDIELPPPPPKMPSRFQQRASSTAQPKAVPPPASTGPKLDLAARDRRRVQPNDLP